MAICRFRCVPRELHHVVPEDSRKIWVRQYQALNTRAEDHCYKHSRAPRLGTHADSSLESRGVDV